MASPEAQEAVILFQRRRRGSDLAEAIPQRLRPQQQRRSSLKGSDAPKTDEAGSPLRARFGTGHLEAEEVRFLRTPSPLPPPSPWNAKAQAACSPRQLLQKPKPVAAHSLSLVPVPSYQKDELRTVLRAAQAVGGVAGSENGRDGVVRCLAQVSAGTQNANETVKSMLSQQAFTTRARKAAHDGEIDAVLQKGLDTMLESAEELSNLIHHLSGHPKLTRANEPYVIQLLPEIAQTVEVIGPKQREDKRLIVQVQCRALARHKGGRPTAQDAFDVQAAETTRLQAAGASATQSLNKHTHLMRVLVEGASLFVQLQSKRAVEVEIEVKFIFGHASTVAQTTAEEAEVNDEEDDEEDTPEQVLLSSGVGRKLQAKLQNLRKEQLHQRLTEQSSLLEASSGNPRRKSTLPFIFEDVKLSDRASTSWRPPRDDTVVMKAQTKAINLLAPCRWFNSKFRRAQGAWVKKLSADCPRKLIRYLRKVVLMRHAMTTLAVAGAAASFLKVQRNVHLEQSRRTLRQLCWYKVLCAAARGQIMMVFLSSRLRSKGQAPKSPGRATRPLTKEKIFGAIADRSDSGTSAYMKKISSGIAWLQTHAKQDAAGLVAKADEDDSGDGEGQEISMSTQIPRTGSPSSARRDKVSFCNLQVPRHPPVPKAPRVVQRLKSRQTTQTILIRSVSLASDARPVTTCSRSLLNLHEEDFMATLSLLQSMLLVMKGKWVLLSSAEQKLFEARMRDHNAHRRAALRKSGLLQPLEAVLWSNPLVFQHSDEVEKVAQGRPPSPTAWKSSLFEGRCEASSDRDPAGLSLGGVRVGDAALRRLADVGGPFLVGTGPLPQPQQERSRVQETKAGIACLHEIQRATAVQPHRDVLERRRCRDTETPGIGAGTTPPPSGRRSVRQQSDAAGDRQAALRMMQTMVPKQVHAQKAELLRYFEGLMTLVREAPSGTSTRPQTEPAHVEGASGVHSLLESSEVLEASKKPHSADVPARFARPLAPPRTAEEVGRMLQASNGDNVHSALRCKPQSAPEQSPGMSYGWHSGAREAPMSSEEIRRTRIIERRCPASLRARRGHD